MTSRSFRSDVVPQNVILWYGESGTLPNGYSHECALFSKYLKGVPNACTNPGSCVGSLTHTDGCAGPISHTHSGSVAIGSHTHAVTWSTVCHVTGVCGAGGNSVGTLNHNHTHPASSSSTANLTALNSVCIPVHNHGCSGNVEPPYITFSNIKKTATIVSFRRKTVPSKALLLNFNQVNPLGYTTSNVGQKNFKGIPNACTSPGSICGSLTHTHPTSAGGHTHTSGTVSAHTHSSSGTSSCGPGGAGLGGSGAVVVAHKSHTHTGTVCLSTVSCVTVSMSCQSHTSSAADSVPDSISAILSKHTSLNSRRNGVPSGMVVAWLGTLANIPSKFRLTDGSCATPILFGKYIRLGNNIGVFDGATLVTLANESNFDFEWNDIIKWDWYGTFPLAISGTNDILFAKGSGNRGIIIDETTSEKLRLLISNTPGFRIDVVTTNAIPIDTTVRHYEIDYDGSGLASGITMKIDGVPVALTINKDTLAGNTILNNDPAQLGGRTGGTNFFNGNLGNMKIYKNGVLVAEYRFGDNLDDTSGNANHGSIETGAISYTTYPRVAVGSTTHIHTHGHVHTCLTVTHKHAASGISSSPSATASVTVGDGNGTKVNCSHTHTAITPSGGHTSGSLCIPTSGSHSHSGPNLPPSKEVAFIMRL